MHAELAPLGIHATVIEPGYFRTDFLDASSLVTSPRIVDDYAATAGRVRELASSISHNQPGDPRRLAQALVALVDAEKPPMRLPLGTDALRVIHEKSAFVLDEAQAWRDLSVSTDFPVGG